MLQIHEAVDGLRAAALMWTGAAAAQLHPQQQQLPAPRITGRRMGRVKGIAAAVGLLVPPAEGDAAVLPEEPVLSRGDAPEGALSLAPWASAHLGELFLLAASCSCCMRVG